jgi:hypothetical protein
MAESLPMGSRASVTTRKKTFGGSESGRGIRKKNKGKGRGKGGRRKKGKKRSLFRNDEIFDSLA